jgi:hypothetical protein
MTEEDFRAAVAAKGYGEPIEKIRQAGLFNDSHAHEFSLFLYITEGMMTLDVDGPKGFEIKVCRPSETIEISAEVLHTEGVGDDGVTYLVARK